MAGIQLCGTSPANIEAGADLSTHEFKFVKLSSGKVVLNDSAGGQCFGVLQNKPNASGVAAAVQTVRGTIVKVVAGAAITTHAKVQSDGAGKAVDAASADSVIGLHISGGGADGSIAEIMLGSDHVLA